MTEPTYLYVDATDFDTITADDVISIVWSYMRREGFGRLARRLSSRVRAEIGRRIAADTLKHGGVLVSPYDVLDMIDA